MTKPRINKNELIQRVATQNHISFRCDPSLLLMQAGLVWAGGRGVSLNGAQSLTQ